VLRAAATRALPPRTRVRAWCSVTDRLKEIDWVGQQEAVGKLIV